MADLATLLGVQLQDKLGDIAAALPHVGGYLAGPQAAGRKGGQAAHDPRDTTPVASASAPPARARKIDASPEEVLPDAPFVSKNGYGQLAEGSERPVASYLPPAGGDRVVTPEPQLFAKGKDGRAYLTQQVPVTDERGRIVDVEGPKNAPTAFLQPKPEDAITPIPNAGPDDLVNNQAPYLTPKDNKTKGVFIDHMKKMYGQMLEEIQNKYGMPA